MPTTNNLYWTTDNEVFLSLPGGEALAEWFGFIPSFHDATLERLKLGEGSASLTLKAFRMTREVNSEGFFVTDKHVLVHIHLSGVTGVKLNGNSSSSIAGLGVRRISSGLPGWDTCDGPEKGDFEVSWDTNWGLEGALYARDVSFEYEPIGQMDIC